jgi:DNA invertase Pin-like site-specific DNA recombinase
MVSALVCFALRGSAAGVGLESDLTVAAEQVLRAIAEFERARIQERVRAGLAKEVS